MNRRSFARSGLAALYASARPRWALAQPTPPRILQYSYVEVANSFGETVTTMVRGTNDASFFAAFLADLYRSVTAYVTADVKAANEAMDRVVKLLPDLAPRVGKLERSKIVGDFPKYFMEMPPKLRDDLQNWKGGNLVSFRIPLQTVNCVVMAVGDQRACVGSIATDVLSCALASFPGAKVGVAGYLAAFGACLLSKPDLKDAPACMKAVLPELDKCFAQ